MKPQRDKPLGHGNATACMLDDTVYTLTRNDVRRGSIHYIARRLLRPDGSETVVKVNNEYTGHSASYVPSGENHRLDSMTVQCDDNERKRAPQTASSSMYTLRAVGFELLLRDAAASQSTNEQGGQEIAHKL